MSLQIRGQGGHLVFTIGTKNTILVEDVAILLPVKYRWIPFNSSRGEVENFTANQRPGRPACFSDRPKTQTWKKSLRSLFLSCLVKFLSAISEENWKMSRPIKGQGGHIVFLIGPENINVVEDVEILLLVKFRWIPFGGFSKVEHVSVNQGPERPSYFCFQKAQAW